MSSRQSHLAGCHPLRLLRQPEKGSQSRKSQEEAFASESKSALVSYRQVPSVNGRRALPIGRMYRESDHQGTN